MKNKFLLFFYIGVGEGELVTQQQISETSARGKCPRCTTLQRLMSIARGGLGLEALGCTLSSTWEKQINEIYHLKGT